MPATSAVLGLKATWRTASYLPCGSPRVAVRRPEPASQTATVPEFGVVFPSPPAINDPFLLYAMLDVQLESVCGSAMSRSDLPERTSQTAGQPPFAKWRPSGEKAAPPPPAHAATSSWPVTESHTRAAPSNCDVNSRRPSRLYSTVSNPSLPPRVSSSRLPPGETSQMRPVPSAP